jgi:hypothetical protein
MTHIYSYSPHSKRSITTNHKELKKMAVEKTNSSSSLAEVIDRILDKGIVIDAWVRFP